MNVTYDQTGTLRAQEHGHQPCVCYGIQGSMIGRKDTNGPNGPGISEDVSFTLTKVDQHTVCYGISAYESNSMKSGNPYSGIYEADTARTLDLNGGNPACNQGGIAVVNCFDAYQHHNWRECDNFGPLTTGVGRVRGDTPLVARMVAFGEYVADGTTSAQKSRDYKDATDLVVNNTVRRLTPLECERLQGYPDNWTNIPGASDSARYKALGNSFAIPCAFHPISGCVEEMKGSESNA